MPTLVTPTLEYEAGVATLDEDSRNTLSSQELIALVKKMRVSTAIAWPVAGNLLASTAFIVYDDDGIFYVLSQRHERWEDFTSAQKSKSFYLWYGSRKELTDGIAKYGPRGFGGLLRFVSRNSKDRIEFVMDVLPWFNVLWKKIIPGR